MEEKPGRGGARPALSLVIPAYEEAPRLPETFRALEAWLAAPPRAPVEVLLVDDGSRDETLRLCRELEAARPGQVRAIAASHRGKGAAVARGILAAEGELVLFSDADLSVPLCDAERLIEAVEQGADVAIGSRELPGSRREEEPSYRHLMGRAFNRMVQLLVLPGIQDTQCGFKLFRRRAAQDVFTRLRRYGPDAPLVRGPMVTAFDVEVLWLARHLGYRVAEVPVAWVHGRGSKVRPVVDALRMARDVAAVKWGAMRGAYDRPAGRLQP